MSIVDDRRPAGGPRFPAARPTELRSWIARIESLRELQHVSGAHWDREIGAIWRRFGTSRTADATSVPASRW